MFGDVRLRTVQDGKTFLEETERGVAVGTQQSAILAGLVVVIHAESPVATADAALSFLLSEDRVVLIFRQPVSLLEFLLAML